MHDVMDNESLHFILSSLGFNDFRGWAVAVNQQVIPREKFEVTFLREGDEEILTQASQGG